MLYLWDQFRGSLFVAVMVIDAYLSLQGGTLTERFQSSYSVLFLPVVPGPPMRPTEDEVLTVDQTIVRLRKKKHNDGNPSAL